MGGIVHQGERPQNTEFFGNCKQAMAIANTDDTESMTRVIVWVCIFLIRVIRAIRG